MSKFKVAMPFKVGDKVRITEVYCGNTYCMEKVGIIKAVNKYPNEISYDIEFDFKFPNGHSGDSGCGNYGHTWTYHFSHFVLANEYAVELI